MKTIDVLKITFINLIRERKKNFIIIISLLGTLVSLVSLTIYITLNNYIQENYYNNIGFRTLNVNQLNSELINTAIDEDEIKNIDGVIEVYNSKYNSFTAESSYKNDDYDGMITLSPITNDLREDLLGKNSIVLKQGQAICPQSFYPDSIAADFNTNIKKNKILSGDNLISTTFEIKYSYYLDEDGDLYNSKKQIMTKNFKVISTYNSNRIMTNANQCYISFNDMKEIVDPLASGINASTYVFIDNINNISYVQSKLNELGYYSEIVNTYDSKVLTSLNTICILISIVSLVTVSILIFLYIKKKLISESSEIGMYKAFGFTNSNIKKVCYTRTLIILFLTYFISVSLFILIFVLFKYIFVNYIYIFNISLTIDFKIFIISFVAVILIPFLLSLISTKKIINKQAIILLKGDE